VTQVIDGKTAAALDSNFDFEIEIQFHFQNGFPENGEADRVL
jgi:hypothetical protein